MSTSSSSTAVKRACDACHRRKVKCIGDGTKACRNCAASSLSCTFNAVPQKKGPKGSRAKVISELRETQRLAAQKSGSDSTPSSPAYSINYALLSNEIIDTCVTYFFANLYPTQPILERSKVREAIARMYDDAEAYAFVVSLCGYMCIQPNLTISDAAMMGLESQEHSTIAHGQALLSEALRVRKSFDWNENPTVLSVITSFFFFGSNFCLDRHNLAWFHLREATTVAQLIGMHEEANYRKGDVVETSRKRRLYWLLFVTERAYALQQHRPLTLHATINLPTADEDPTETVGLTGFIHLVNLFRPFDDTFVGLWNKANPATPPGDWLRGLQQDLSDALPLYLDCTESQAVDLRLSQSWLKTMVWQLSISHGALSSLATDNAMSLSFPIEISRDLVAASSQYSQFAMEVHGIGLVEKLFDVACTLTDVISCVPCGSPSITFGPRDYLSQMIQLISKLRGGQQRFMPLLTSKIHETMPSTMSYDLPLIPATSGSLVSEGATSTSSSENSTPFGSPPFSEVDSQSVAFHPQSGFEVSPTFSDFPGVVMTNGIDYGEIAIPAPMHLFSDPVVYQHTEDMLKFEPNG